MKHAFPDGTNGEINIDFYLKDDVYFLKVSDNGIGFPEDLDFRKTESLGLKLVDTLSRQIDATVKLDRSHGTSFIIKFKEREY
jgi:two-component sensor histidine kinase